MADHKSRVLYHIGQRPGKPEPAQTRGQGGKWKRPKQRAEPFTSGIFLSDNPHSVSTHHGVFGHVYAYRVPEWVIKKAGGMQRYDNAKEIVIPQELWDTAGSAIKFLGKAKSSDKFADEISSEWSPRTPRAARATKGMTGYDVRNLVTSKYQDDVIKMMNPDEIERSIEQLEDIIASEREQKSQGLPFGQRYDTASPEKRATLKALRAALKEGLLRQAIREMLTERATEFEDWLTPDVMSLLISNYAEQHEILGRLKWSYKKLQARRWGEYVPGIRTLHVNDAKTKGLFKQQVETILHEIQHWNQHCEVADLMADNGEVDLNAFEGPGDEMIPSRWSKPMRRADVQATELRRIAKTKNNLYDRSMGAGNSRYERYFSNKFEEDARNFAAANLEGAMTEIGKHYGGKIEGGALDDVIEELVDEYDPAGPPLTRYQIGTTLKDWDLNTGSNMKKVLAQLKDLGVKVS